MNRTSVALALLLALIIPTPPLDARGAPAQTSPGKYSNWGGRVAEVEVVRSFSLAKFDAVAVAPVSARKVTLPGNEENTYEPVKKVIAAATSTLIEGLSKGLEGKSVRQGGGGKKTLVVRTSITMIDPGSRARRYLGGGFAGGAARVGMSGEILDSSGRVLIRFRQENKAKISITGGSYEAMLNRDIRATGADIAYIVQQFP